MGPDHNAALTRVTALRFPQVIVAGSVVAAVVAYPADRLRSLACLVAPAAGPGHLRAGGQAPGRPAPGDRTVVPVGLDRRRRRPGRRRWCWPCRARWRTLALIVGSAYTLWMAVAVIALQWHLPTDALAGAAYGAGVVLVVDGAVWALGAVRGGTARRRPTTSRGG